MTAKPLRDDEKEIKPHRGNFKILFLYDLKHRDNSPLDPPPLPLKTAIRRGKNDNVFLFSVPSVNIAVRIN